MKKIIIIIIIILSIIIGINIIRDKNIKSEIPKYKADIICKNTEIEIIDEEEISIDNNIYITLSDNMVDKVIIQSVKELEYKSDAEIMLIDSLINIYKPYNGIEGSVFTTNTYLITEFRYDYKKIDLDFIKSELGNILDSNTLLMKVDKLPVSYLEYKEIELDGYECVTQK